MNEYYITVIMCCVAILFVIFGMKYLTKIEIKFYEKAQNLETKLKDDDDMIFDEAIELFNKINKMAHLRSDYHRIIELTKMIEVRYHKELAENK